jgi:hypothetical protein
MIVNRLTKMKHYISCLVEKESISIQKTARLLINQIWKLHDLLDTIISNRESQFIFLIWKSVCKTLKIIIKLSIAFHSEIDEQSEIANQKIKRYLRNYCNYQQDDWANWLSIAKFAFNACISLFTDLFSFMTNYDFESRISFDLISTENTTRERILTKKTVDIFEKMKEIWKFIKKKLVTAQKSQKRQANKTRKKSSNYKIKDLVWFFTKNIKTSKSFKKLDHKMIDSYKITKVFKSACQLDLSTSLKIHNSFHISLLRLAFTDSLINQIQSSSSLIIVDEKEKYEVNHVLNSRYHYNKLQYRVSWTEHSSNNVWYSAENFDQEKYLNK